MSTVQPLARVIALAVVGLLPPFDLPGVTQCAFAQGPLSIEEPRAQEALARLRGMWTDARGLSLTLECQAKRSGRLIADEEGHLLVDWTEPVYESREPGGALFEDGIRRYLVASDGVQVREFDSRSRRTFTHPVEGRPRAASSQLAYIELPFPGSGGYFKTLLRDVDGPSARLEASDAGRSELVLPLAKDAQPSYILEYRVLFDPEFTHIEVIRVVGHDQRGPIGMRWTMHSVEALSDPPSASMLRFELPRDAIEVDERAFRMPLVGDVVPEFAVATLDGSDFSLDTALGTKEVVLVQFWGSWCGPCLRELPHIEALAQEYRARGLAVLGLACDDTPDAARAAAERAKVTYPIAVDAARSAGLNAQLGVRAFPTLLLIGEGRRVLWHSHARLGEVEAALERALPR